MNPPVEQGWQATGQLMPRVYDELRRIAGNYLRRYPPDFTLQTTEIVHEAYIHLAEHGRNDWQGEAHLRAIAAKKIWQVLIDYLRRRNSKCRGGPRGAPRHEPGNGRSLTPSPGGEVQSRAWRRVPLESVEVRRRDDAVYLLDLADALDALAAECRRLADVVKLHWFGGLTYAQVAVCLGVSPSTVEKDSRYALAWLKRRLAVKTRHVD